MAVFADRLKIVMLSNLSQFAACPCWQGSFLIC